MKVCIDTLDDMTVADFFNTRFDRGIVRYSYFAGDIRPDAEYQRYFGSYEVDVEDFRKFLKNTAEQERYCDKFNNTNFPIVNRVKQIYVRIKDEGYIWRRGQGWVKAAS